MLIKELLRMNEEKADDSDKELEIVKNRCAGNLMDLIPELIIEVDSVYRIDDEEDTFKCNFTWENAEDDKIHGRGGAKFSCGVNGSKHLFDFKLYDINGIGNSGATIDQSIFTQ